MLSQLICARVDKIPARQSTKKESTRSDGHTHHFLTSSSNQGELLATGHNTFHRHTISDEDDDGIGRQMSNRRSWSSQEAVQQKAATFVLEAFLLPVT